MTKNFRDWLYEGISNANAFRAAKLIRQYLQKKTGMKFLSMPGVEVYKNSFGSGYGVRYFFDGNKSIRFNWHSTAFNSADLSSVDFWDGTSYDPKWNLDFDVESSLSTILPFVADILQGPIKIGTYIAMPADTLNEEAPEPYMAILNEAYQDAFDGVIEYIKPGQAVPIFNLKGSLGSRGHKIIMGIREAYPNLFDKVGREIFFRGSKHDIDSLRKNKEQIIRRLGGTKVTIKPGANNETYKQAAHIEAMDADLERIAYEDQLADLKSLTRLLVKGASNGLFVAGRGGTGKTETVTKTMGELGLTDGNGYFKNSGSASPPGIYRLLYQHRDSIILFDDSDTALADQEGRNLLKAATDTQKVRKLVWSKMSAKLLDPDVITDADIEAGFLPSHFEFTGKVIFVSNLSLNKLDPDKALRTRGYIISIDPTDEELVNFMRKICDDIEVENDGGMTHEHRLEVVDLLAKNKGDLNLRKLVRGLKIRAAALNGGTGDWERLIRYYA